MALYLSCDIPDFEQSSTKTEDNFRLYRNGSCIFTSIVYPYNNKVHANDLRGLVEQDMINNNLSYAKYTYRFIGSQDSFEVLFCNWKNDGTNETFYQTRFLTSAKSKILTRRLDTLYYYAGYGECPVKQYLIMYKANGTINLHIKKSDARVLEEGVEESDAPAGVFKVEVDPSLYTDLGEILSITTFVGDRCFTHYYTDNPVELTLLYRNPFNVLELLEVQGKDVHKLEMEQSEAVIDRKLYYYDRTRTDSHEFESAPLPYDMAWHLAEIYSSHKVYLVDRAFDSHTELNEILIDESTIEASDEKGKLSNIKLVWRFPDDSSHLNMGATEDNIFRDPFEQQFT